MLPVVLLLLALVLFVFGFSAHVLWWGLIVVAVILLVTAVAGRL